MPRLRGCRWQPRTAAVATSWMLATKLWTTRSSTESWTHADTGARLGEVTLSFSRRATECRAERSAHLHVAIREVIPAWPQVTRTKNGIQFLARSSRRTVARVHVLAVVHGAGGSRTAVPLAHGEKLQLDPFRGARSVYANVKERRKKQRKIRFLFFQSPKRIERRSSGLHKFYNGRSPVARRQLSEAHGMIPIFFIFCVFLFFRQVAPHTRGAYATANG
jgi:hypothetical protein